MNKADIWFKEKINEIMNEGATDAGWNVRPKYKDGQPAYTKYLTQQFQVYDLNKGEFPIVTLRPLAWKSAIKEILWIYQDQSNDLTLLENKYGIKWWRDWEVEKTNTIGQRYGATVRRYDLINDLIKKLKTDPMNRRLVLNMFQYSDLKETAGLAPCAYETIWSTRIVGSEVFLDLTLIQRSNDMLVANSINGVQYVALQMMIAGAVGMKIGKFVHYINNLHIYDRHFEQAAELLKRPVSELQPSLVLKESKPFKDYTINDFEIVNYQPSGEQLKLELAI